MFEDYFQKGGIGGFCFASSDNIKSKNAMNHFRVPLIVASWHPGWEEMENLRGNLKGSNS